MPMIGHLAEAGAIVYDDFRKGNVAPATGNLEFTKVCEARLLKVAAGAVEIFRVIREKSPMLAVAMSHLRAPRLEQCRGAYPAAWQGSP